MTDETMTLGEALTVRADMQRRLAELRTRLLASAKVQEGETPPEQPDVLLAEFEQTAAQLRTLIARINRTNLTVETAAGPSSTMATSGPEVMKLTSSSKNDLPSCSA